MPEIGDLSSVCQPSPLEPIRSEASRWMAFVRTYRAVRAGRPLYAFSAQDLATCGFMGPWLFNIAKSTIAAAAGTIVLWVLKQLFSAPPTTVAPQSTYWGRVLAEIVIVAPEVESWLAPLILLLTTITFARIVGWGSVRSEHATADVRRRATAAYLYFEGAYALFANVLFVTGASIVVALVRRQIVSSGLWFWGASLLLCGMALGYRFMHYRLPALLFPVNGYSSYVRSILVGPRSHSEASWRRYELTLNLGSALAFMVAWISIMAASVIVAIPLSMLRAVATNNAVERRQVVASDLERVVKHYSSLALLENDMVARYSLVTGLNYRDDATLRQTLVSEVIPRSDQLLHQLRKIRPQTAPVSRIHELALESAQARHDGFAKLLRAIDTQDQSLLSDSNRLLQEAQIQQSMMLGLIRDVATGRAY